MIIPFPSKMRCVFRGVCLTSSVIVVVLGTTISSFGAVTGTGDFFPNPPEENTTVQVGNNGYGTFRVDGGTAFTSSYVTLGGGSNGFGRATVTDEGSVWTMSGANIGQSGVGQLEIRNGGVAFINSTVGIGSSSGRGEVNVTGAGSLLQLNSQLYVGQNGSGLLTIGAGAMVNLPNSQIVIGAAGQLQLDGGTLRASSLGNSGVISGSGLIEIECCGSQANSRILVESGDHLVYRSLATDEIGNLGEYLVHGGELEIPLRLENGFQGLQRGFIELSQGTLRVGFPYDPSSQQQFENRGLLAAISGENHVYGTVRNDFNGDIAITNNSLLMFHHDVVGYSNSTISVSAGSSAIFLQDLRLDGGTLLADLTGAAGFGHVEVIGDFEFSGDLMVNLADGYSPQLGDSFPLATVSGEITGSPNTNLLPVLADGLAWELTAEEHEVVLSVIEAPGLTGDFDGDGDVDGRDFLSWQRDPSIGNLSDWQENYGSPTGLANAVAVPEPACMTILAACLGLVGVGQRARNPASLGSCIPLPRNRKRVDALSLRVEHIG
jgi:T5SS/PEP-CTERM-associated repeat protein